MNKELLKYISGGSIVKRYSEFTGVHTNFGLEKSSILSTFLCKCFMDDFSKQKIVWGNLGLTAGFAQAPENMYVNAPCPMITPFNKYLLAVLNSKLGDWYIRQLGVTRNGGYFEYKPMFVSQLPVPMLSASEQLVIIRKMTEAQTEEACEQIISKLYGLSEEEQYFILTH